MREHRGPFAGRFQSAATDIDLVTPQPAFPAQAARRYTEDHLGGAYWGDAGKHYGSATGYDDANGETEISDYAFDNEDWDDGGTSAPAAVAPVRPRGAHRLAAPPSSLKGRAAVVAVAAGAVVAAGHSAISNPAATAPATSAAEDPSNIALAANSAPSNAHAAQVLTTAAPTSLGQYSDVLQTGSKFAKDRAAKEAAAMRPMFALFARGAFTSGYGARWGALHAGLDVAAPIGTPIYAVADGVVQEAGPAAGFGMWVRLLHADGTTTIYGHVDTTTVNQGQRVMAGDQIATVGNRGYSTGPHVHFEVWLAGGAKIDPLPWLASRGISLGPERS